MTSSDGTRWISAFPASNFVARDEELAEDGVVGGDGVPEGSDVGTDEADKADMFILSFAVSGGSMEGAQAR